MKRIELKIENPKILVFRNSGIGNTIVDSVFLKLIKEIYPKCTTYCVLDNIGEKLLKENPYIDKIDIFNRRTDNLYYQWKLLKQWRKEKIDISFHLRSGIRQEILAFLSGIPVRVGFKLNGSFQFLTHIINKNKDFHRINNSRLLLALLKEDIPEYFPELYQCIDDKKFIYSYLKKHGFFTKNYIIMHPCGKTYGNENWNLDFYSKIVKKLRSWCDYPIFIIGNKSEICVVKKILGEKEGLTYLMNFHIGQISELINNSLLFIGNDSGPAHIAEAWNVPKVVVYRDDHLNFIKWSPLRKDLSLVIFQHELINQNTFTKIYNFLKILPN